VTASDRLQTAISLHQQGRLGEAESLYRQILASRPNDFDALHRLGVVRHQQGHSVEALEFIERALKRNPGSARALANRGLVLHALGRHDEALKSFDRLLALQPDDAEGHFLRGNALAEVGRYGEALASYDRALRLRPNAAEILGNRGNALAALTRYEDALASFDQALKIKPDDAEAHANRARVLARLRRHHAALESLDRALALKPDDAEAHNTKGNVLSALGRHAEALASHERALAIRPGFSEALNNCGSVLSALARHEEALARFDEALAVAPRYAVAWCNRGNALAALRRYEEALASYDQALALEPRYAEALDGGGNALLNLYRHEEALASFDRALALAPGNARTYNNRGVALGALKRHEPALASYQRALALEPDFVDALSNRGHVLKELRRHEEALASFERALAIDPEHADASTGRAEALLSLCDWARTEKSAGELVARVAAGKRVAPLTLLACCDDPALHRQCAETFVAARMPVKPAPLWSGPAMRRDKIRIAYLSADFHRHATAHLMAELFELHDRARFDVLGLGFDGDDGSDLRRRLVKAFDQFYDVRTRSDREVARLLLSLEVDIAIDLKGHSAGSRPGIFAHRPAPIQASYLGYPGTLGADFIDYIIADPVVAPLEHEPFYVEKIVRLPDCYQVNDRQRAIAERAPSRREAGLPADGFVLCCFNNTARITAPVFDAWMRLMQAVPGSVLWLLRDNVGAERNLRREAQRRGVDPVRLVFAGRTTLADHLARHRLADLFLDTLPYNAHATASDALWAGVPLLTCQGSAFAGRVGASLLRAAGLPELVTESLPDYEALALRLATDKALLGALRQKLARNRRTCALFDTDRFRRHIEAAYATMWEICLRGEAARSFAVEGQD
jgi:predicted O-linked N-acetylglucosamine transferase (SPINDLY family)